MFKLKRTNGYEITSSGEKSRSKRKSYEILFHNNEWILSMNYQYTVLALVRRKAKCLLVKDTGFA